MTTPTEALAMLEKAGTVQVRKAHARHGVTRRMYGVSAAGCRAVARRLGTDQTLAATLWASGNHDARVLATLIADPGAMDAATLDRWVADCDNHLIADAVSELVARTAGARQLAERWSRDLGEWRGAVGWTVLALLAAAPGGPDDDWFRALLPAIVETIHQRPNHTRHAMNGALVAIGARSAGLQKDALRAAGRIGPVHVDHGETEGRTPPAAEAIVALVALRKARAASPPTEAAVAGPPLPAANDAAVRQPATTEATPRAQATAGTMPAAKKSAAKKPAAKKSAAKKPAAKKPAAKKPAAKKPAAKKPAARKPAAKKPAARKPAAKKPAVKKPAARKPAAKKPAVKKPAARKPAARTAAAKKPAAKKPAARKPAAKKPAARKAAAMKPAARKAAAKKPAAKKPAATKAAGRGAGRS